MFQKIHERLKYSEVKYFHCACRATVQLRCAALPLKAVKTPSSCRSVCCRSRDPERTQVWHGCRHVEHRRHHIHTVSRSFCLSHLHNVYTGGQNCGNTFVFQFCDHCGCKFVYLFNVVFLLLRCYAFFVCL